MALNWLFARPAHIAAPKSRIERDCPRHQPAGSPQPDSDQPADFARRSGSRLGLTAQHDLADCRAVDRRALGARRPHGRLPRGLRPTYLRLNNERVIIGVDIRPTQTTVADPDVNGRFTAQEVTATSARCQGGHAGTHASHPANQAHLAQRTRKSRAIGISLPGRFDATPRQRLVFAPNLKLGRRGHPQSAGGGHGARSGA